MKELKQLSTAVVLVIMLATSTFAGIIQFPVAPPSSSSNSSSETTPGIIDTPGVTNAAMAFVQSMLSRF
jgi:hypothetical protein